MTQKQVKYAVRNTDIACDSNEYAGHAQNMQVSFTKTTTQSRRNFPFLE